MGSRGLWRFMGARTRRSLTLTWTALFVLSLLLQYFSFAAAHAGPGRPRRGTLRARRQRRSTHGRRAPTGTTGADQARVDHVLHRRRPKPARTTDVLHDRRLEGRQRHPELGAARHDQRPGQGRPPRRASPPSTRRTATRSSTSAPTASTTTATP